jgi:hypothetical protein
MCCEAESKVSLQSTDRPQKVLTALVQPIVLDDDIQRNISNAGTCLLPNSPIESRSAQLQRSSPPVKCPSASKRAIQSRKRKFVTSSETSLHSNHRVRRRKISLRTTVLDSEDDSEDELAFIPSQSVLDQIFAASGHRRSSIVLPLKDVLENNGARVDGHIEDSDGSVYIPEDIEKPAPSCKSLIQPLTQRSQSSASCDFDNIDDESSLTAEYREWPVRAFFKLVQIPSRHTVCSIEVDLEDGHPLAQQLGAGWSTAVVP